VTVNAVPTTATRSEPALTSKRRAPCGATSKRARPRSSAHAVTSPVTARGTSRLSRASAMRVPSDRVTTRPAGPAPVAIACKTAPPARLNGRSTGTRPG
jgi:hypothetical protein